MNEVSLFLTFHLQRASVVEKRAELNNEMSSLDDALREAERIAAEMDMFMMEEEMKLEVRVLKAGGMRNFQLRGHLSCERKGQVFVKCFKFVWSFFSITHENLTFEVTLEILIKDTDKWSIFA